jgi:hypothetical protein
VADDCSTDRRVAIALLPRQSNPQSSNRDPFDAMRFDGARIAIRSSRSIPVLRGPTKVRDVSVHCSITSLGAN